ncbi:hypothetical protein CSC12_6241 (plasmid) [Klebsiella michiganensis]|nr:hypothetical protein CSC12_6241 [Klebsiella michiganensis]
MFTFSLSLFRYDSTRLDMASLGDDASLSFFKTASLSV